MDSEAHQKMHLEQLIAKLQRKSHGISKEEREAFETLSGGLTVKQLIESLKEKDTAEVKKIPSRQTESSFFFG